MGLILTAVDGAYKFLLILLIVKLISLGAAIWVHMLESKSIET